MAELKKLLSALIKGRQSLEQVTAAFEQFLVRSPEKAPLVAKLLRAAREAGLSHPMYVALSGDLGLRVDLGRDPDATVLALDDDLDQPDGPASARNPVTPESGALPLSEHRRRHAGDDTGSGGIETTHVALALSAPGAAEPRAPGEAPDDATQMDAVLDNPISADPALDPAVALHAVGSDPVFTGTKLPDPVKSHATRAHADATGKTIALAAEADFDVFSDEALASAEQTADPHTGASWPTVREQRHPGVSRAFRKGDQLRNRFELISQLGQGGMGAVWKGKDLLKEEARDRNPFVAIKLLQGDFKEYPEAFIALQRETAKQQRLAHPNIATVYDFDRDDSSNTVYMTMQVLEGQPLDAFIRRLPAGGLAVEEAMPLIEQLCNGLAYAHSHGLVHADLKPGNCFYTKDGTLKLLDFGIARASKTKTDAEGETTLFDPGEFGALTPAYATVDMFEGADPDPRDDIYALAIMAYQLLTGKHPYDKKAAPKARELGLKPEPVAKLNKRQNRALMRGLAFEREDRTATVEDFFESLRPKKNRTAMTTAAALAAMVIIGFAGRGPALDLIDKIRREQIISMIDQHGVENVRAGLDQARALADAEQLGLILNDRRTKDAVIALIAGGGEARVDEWLALIDPFNPEWQREVKEIERAKSAILDVFDSRIDQVFNVERNRYDFAAAADLIAELDRLYPESEDVLQREERLNQERASALAALSDSYTRQLEEGQLLAGEGERHIGDVIEAVRRIDPEHPLLEDRRLRFRYAELAEEAIEGADYGRAGALLNAGLIHAPGDSKLSDLRFRLRFELERIADERRAAEIERRLGPRLALLNALPDFLQIRDDLIALGYLSAESGVLAAARDKLRSLLENRLDRSTGQDSLEASERMLSDFSPLFEVSYLSKQRRRLSELAAKEGQAFAMTSRRRTAIDQGVRRVSKLLAKPDFSGEWEIGLTNSYKELVAMLPPGDPVLEQVRRQTARAYLQHSKSALESERFFEALVFVQRGRVFHPELRHFEDFEEAIVARRKSWELRRQAEQRLARIDALKADFRLAVGSGRVEDAEARLADVRAEGLPAEDSFLVRDAPLELANAYLRLARERAEGEQPDYETALGLAGKGLEIAPQLEALRFAVASYERELKKGRLEARFHRLFDGGGQIDVAAAKSGLQEFRRDFPERYRDLRRELAEIRGNRIRELANAEDLRISSLHQGMDEYRALFPQKAPALHQSVSLIVEKRIRAAQILSAGDLEALSAALSDFRAFSPTAYASLSRDLSSQIGRRIQALERTDRAAAVGLLEASIEQFGAASFAGLEIEPEPDSIR